MCGRDAGLLAPQQEKDRRVGGCGSEGLQTQHSVEGGWPGGPGAQGHPWLATREFQGRLESASLSQEAENGSGVGGWKEEEDGEENESRHPFLFLPHSTEQGSGEGSFSCI